MYTLADYYKEAQIESCPAFAAEVVLWDKRKEDYLRPRWHQVTGLNLTMSFDNNRAALFDDMGTGKTLISQAYAAWHAGNGNGVVCLMPPVLTGQYKASFLTMLKGIDQHLDIEVYRGTKPQRNKMLKAWADSKAPDVVITSYDLFRMEHEVFEDYEVLVMDEARILNNEHNKTYAAIELFMGDEGNKAALVMNGTPARTDLSKLYGLIQFITPSAYLSRSEFDLTHVIYKEMRVKYRTPAGAERERWVSAPESFRNLDLLHQNLYRQARRVEKRDVIELPPVDIVDIEVELSPQHAALYEQLVDERLIIFDDNTVLDATQSSSARNSCMQAILHTDLLQLGTESAVIDMIKELLEEVDLEKTKVFMLCHYQKSVELLAEVFAEYNPAMIYGKSNSQKEKDKFLEDKSCRIAIANYLAGGVGLDLQDVCHTAIFVEPIGSPGDFDQAISRLDRAGQLNKVTAYVITVPGTVYATTVSTMLKRKEVISTVMTAGDLRAELKGGKNEC